VNGSVKHFTVTGRAHRAGKLVIYAFAFYFKLTSQPLSF
jgi:hypothetical protein